MEQRRVVAGLAGIAAFALAWSGSKAFFSQRHVASPEFLARVAAEMNKTLPMMVDKDTELSSTIGISGVLVYNYRLVNHSASEAFTTSAPWRSSSRTRSSFDTGCERR